VDVIIENGVRSIKVHLAVSELLNEESQKKNV